MKLVHCTSVAAAFAFAFAGCVGPVTSVQPARPQPVPESLQKGPKLWVGVMEFENRAGGYSDWHLGEGMADQLVTALVATGRFNVLERERLEKVMKEQDMAQTDRFAKGEFAKTGRLLRCQYLIKGTITEFQYRKGGGGGGISTPWGVTLGRSKSHGYVVVDIRMVDTSTGKVVAADRAEGRAEGRWVHVSGTSATGWGFGSTKFQKTPIGQALRACIDHSARLILEKLGSRPYYTYVLAEEDGSILIAGGREIGMTPGLEFTLKSRKADLQNPVTGEVIRRYETAGACRVESVEDGYSICVPTEGSGFKKGDRAELVM